MKIQAPTSKDKVKMWRAQFGLEDRLTPELLAPLMARYGLDLPQNYSGENASPYLAAAAGTSLNALLRVSGQQQASRIDSSFSEARMVIAAVAERIGIDSYQNFTSFYRYFDGSAGFFSSFSPAFAGLMDPEDAAYLVATYYTNFTDDERNRVQHFLAEAACATIKHGRDPLGLLNHARHRADLLTHLFFISQPDEFGFGGAPRTKVARLFAIATLDFSESEIEYLLDLEEATPQELHVVLVLRGEYGPDRSASELLAEARSMPIHWLTSLLA